MADPDKYQRWAEGMTKWGYTWEPYEVTTEDGFVVTLFRVTGNSYGAFKPDKGAVLI